MTASAPRAPLFTADSPSHAFGCPTCGHEVVGVEPRPWEGYGWGIVTVDHNGAACCSFYEADFATQEEAQQQAELSEAHMRTTGGHHAER